MADAVNTGVAGPLLPLFITGVAVGVGLAHVVRVAFVLVMTGFLVQWPTLLRLAMFPVLVVMYTRHARREEAGMRAEFGEAHAGCAAMTPAWGPNSGGPDTRRHELLKPVRKPGRMSKSTTTTRKQI